MIRAGYRAVVPLVFLVLAGALTPLPTGATSVPTVTRFEGATAAEEAVAVSDRLFPLTATVATAVLVRDDASGTAPFAGGVAAAAGGPVLTTGQSTVPTETLDELVDLEVETVVLMGDETVIDAGVVATLETAGYVVERAETALQAAERAAGGSAVPIAYLVGTGETSEQLLAGPAAVASGGVVLEVAPGALSPEVEAFLTSHGVERAVLVGSAGQGSAGKELADALEALDVAPTPLYGRTLRETGVALSETAFRQPAGMILVGDALVHDALIASGLGALGGAPVLLTDPLTDPFASFVAGALNAHAPSVEDLWIVGGQLSVDDTEVAHALDLLVPIEPYPLEDVTDGLLGEAHTVVKGIDPVTFDVEVIDVLPNGIAPGLDLILVRASGPVIDATKGIVSGMSGSPVYVDDGGERKLLGAVAYGCFSCDQTIGGVTPAEDMLDVLTYPGKPSSSTSSLSSTVLPSTIQARVDGEPAEVRQLQPPLAVGGLSLARFKKVAADLDRAGIDVRAYRAGSVSGPVFAPFDPIFPGHSFAGVISAGSLTAGAIGTTTYRAGDRSLAFGHPFLFEGPSGLGLFSAKISTVVPDPSQIFGGYKQGRITGPHGIMDQDRLAAVAGTEGTFPDAAAILTDVTNLDASISRSMRSDAPMTDFFPDVAAISLLAGLDRTFDRIGEGTVGIEWTIEGRDSDGDPFSVSRGDRFASEFDVSFEAIWDLLIAVFRIQENDFEEVTFDRIDAEAEVTQLVLRRRIAAARARVGGGSWKRQGRLLRVRPGRRILVEVTLRQRREPDIKRQLAVRVPRSAFGRGMLQVVGGAGGFDDFFFFFDHQGPSNGPKSLDDVLASIEKQGRNDTITLRLRVPSRIGPRSITQQTPWVVSGQARFPVLVVRR